MTATVKVLRFLAGGPSLPDELRRRWATALAAGPAPGRPVRVTLGVPVAVPELAPPPVAAVDVQWFADVGEAVANEAWLAATDPDLGPGPGSMRVVADEVVLRGRDHLAARWAAGDVRCKMMSYGRRHPTLSAAAFSARWRDEAGSYGGEPIPDDVRGSAYVQNHPVAVNGHEWPLDAVNEVYVAGLGDLRRRAAWFAARRPGDGVPFMSPTATWSIAVQEEVLWLMS